MFNFVTTCISHITIKRKARLLSFVTLAVLWCKILDDGRALELLVCVRVYFSIILSG